MKAYMDDLARSNHFNGAVSVIYKDEVLLQDAYGISSYQYDVPIRKDTKFRIGSLTKAFTAMAILILHEKGKVGLHDTIEQYFPDFPHGKRVTIHHLLTNTSGIYNFTDSPNYWETTMRKQASIQDILKSISELPLNFEPGEKMEYSNTGYLFLTAIIEKVSGLSYADFLEINLLSKLGLTNTGVDNGRTIVKGLATGYTVWEEIILSEFVDMSFPLGAYGMYSSVVDLQIRAKALRNHQLIREDLQKLMFSSFGNGYGYGWFIDSKENRASHFGDINGSIC
jgi:CubicO group peptidase (beta-lactamase class C family)